MRRARAIAEALAVERGRDQFARRRVGDLTSARYSGGSDEIDLDQTLATLVERPLLADEDVTVRERTRDPRAVALVVDVSGSMGGERLLTTAATICALGAEFSRDQLAVVAFWSEAAVMQHLGEQRQSRELLEAILRLKARGLTNIEFALRTAHRELANALGSDVRALLLTDCVHNAGPDPRATVVALPRCDVLFDSSGEHDKDLARDIASLGRGKVAGVRTYRDVAPAITKLFRP